MKTVTRGTLIASGLVLLLPACAVGTKSALRVENASLKEVVDQADAAVRNCEERNRVLEERLQAEMVVRKTAEEQVLMLRDAVQKLRGSIGVGLSAEFEGIREGFEINPESGAIILEDAVYFAPGKHRLSKAGRGNLQVLANRLILAQYARFNVRVDGHTDNQPIVKSPYVSTWHLGFARAKAVQDMLASAGVEASRLFVASFADTQPIASNSTASGRRKNRRVEVQITEGIPEQK